MRITRTSWFLPLFSVALGVAVLAAFWIGDRPRDGLASLAVMAFVGAIFLLGGRSEMIRGLRGDGRDEYWARMDARASLFAGMVLLTAVLGMCLWEWAHERDGSPYTALGAISGVAYLAALAVLRVRS